MKQLIGIKEASDMLGVSKSTLRLWDKEGKLKSVKTKGGHRRYRLADLTKMQQDNNQEADLLDRFLSLSKREFIDSKEAENVLKTEFPYNKTSVIANNKEIVLSVDSWSVKISLDKEEDGRRR